MNSHLTSIEKLHTWVQKYTKIHYYPIQYKMAVVNTFCKRLNNFIQDEYETNINNKGNCKKLKV